MVATQVLGPMLKKFGDDMKGIGRNSGGMVSAEVSYDAPEELEALTEVDDMTRVDFDCHPTEPVKVLDDWDKPVRCLICGSPSRRGHCGSGSFSTKTSTPRLSASVSSRMPSSSIFSASTLPTGADISPSIQSKSVPITPCGPTCTIRRS